MSVLPAGRPVRGLVPDLDDLLDDPAGYLRAQPIVVGPRRMYGLAALFGVPGLVFLLSCLVTGPDPERIALGIGLLLGALVWLGWSLRLRGHSLVLHPDGLEVRFLDTSVWCPWALFNVDGQPFVPESDSPRAGLTLPVDPAAVPYVELRREDSPVAHGAEVRAPQWQPAGPDEVVLPARYEVAASDLGQLLLDLGRRLGRELPRGVPAAAGVWERPEEAPDEEGWVTVRLAELTFPPECCSCGRDTDETMAFAGAPGMEQVTAALVVGKRGLEVRVPVCEECQEDLRERQQRGASLGTTIGALLLTALGLPLAALQGVRDLSTLMLVAIATLATGGLIGMAVGSNLHRRAPVQLGRYSPTHGTLALRFRNPQYARHLLDALRRRRALGAGRPPGQG